MKIQSVNSLSKAEKGEVVSVEKKYGPPETSAVEIDTCGRICCDCGRQMCKMVGLTLLVTILAICFALIVCNLYFTNYNIVNGLFS